MRTRTTADRQSPVFGISGAIVLHVAIIAAFAVTWAQKLEFADQSTPIVPVELVTPAEKTNVAPLVKPEAIEAPASLQSIQPEPVQPVLPKLEVAPAEVKKPVAPKPKPEPKKTKADEFKDMLEHLKPAQATAPSDAKTGNQTTKGTGNQTAMTADLKAILKSEIYRCWSPNMGVPNAENLIVKYELYLNPDGTVAQPPQSDADSASVAASNPFLYAAAEAAKRAIYACQPYRLPADRYSQWRDVTFIFDPRDIADQ